MSEIYIRNIEAGDRPLTAAVLDRIREAKEVAEGVDIETIIDREVAIFAQQTRERLKRARKAIEDHAHAALRRSKANQEGAQP